MYPYVYNNYTIVVRFVYFFRRLFMRKIECSTLRLTFSFNRQFHPSFIIVCMLTPTCIRIFGIHSIHIIHAPPPCACGSVNNFGKWQKQTHKIYTYILAIKQDIEMHIYTSGNVRLLHIANDTTNQNLYHTQNMKTK